MAGHPDRVGLDADDDTLDDEGGVDIDYYPDELLIAAVARRFGAQMAELVRRAMNEPA